MIFPPLVIELCLIGAAITMSLLFTIASRKSPWLVIAAAFLTIGILVVLSDGGRIQLWSKVYGPLAGIGYYSRLGMAIIAPIIAAGILVPPFFRHRPLQWSFIIAAVAAWFPLALSVDVWIA